MVSLVRIIIFNIVVVNWFLKNRRSLQQHVYFYSLLLFVLSLPFAESMISIVSGVILLQALLFFRVSDRRWADPSLWLLVSVFGVYLIGCLFTNDVDLATYELKKNMFWLVIPLGIGLSPKLSPKHFYIILLAFAVAVTLSSLFSVVRLFFVSSTLEGNFRYAHYVSHISFSLQVIFAFLILVHALIKKPEVFRSIKPLILILWAAYLVFFLIMLKSMVGLVSFYVLFPVLAIYVVKTMKDRRLKQILFFGSVLVWLFPIGYVTKVGIDFFKVKDSVQHLKTHTANGRAYAFDFENKQKENGYYTYWYICEEELVDAWNKRSNLSFDELDAKDYLVGETLIRYMTAKGLKKDSAGVAALSVLDIENIQNGMTNPVFGKSIVSLYPRLYETMWEIDKYFRTGDANDQSLSQRIEYAKAALHISRNHLLWGIGTGNFKDAYHKAHVEMNSKLQPELYGIAHNQYLNHLVKFGIIGLMYILAVLVLVVILNKQKHNSLLLLFLISIMVANLGENNFETHVGLSYFVLFYSLLVWHTPEPNPTTKLNS